MDKWEEGNGGRWLDKYGPTIQANYSQLVNGKNLPSLTRDTGERMVYTSPPCERVNSLNHHVWRLDSRHQINVIFASKTQGWIKAGE